MFLAQLNLFSFRSDEITVSININTPLSIYSACLKELADLNRP
jgi:hypothetical protein